MKKKDIKSLYLEELEEELGQLGEKSFRAKQIYQWVHQKLAADFEDMSNLSKALREKLRQQYTLTALNPVEVKISKIDGTRKYLFRLSDGNVIESVWMQYHHGNSVCISSQVGCRMGCRFCASTLDGLERNLTAGEMLDQIYRIQADTGERVSNIVIMGSGEPMDNYDNVVRFIRLISHDQGLNISQRNITVSTCGIVPGIRRLAKEGLSVTLALSLHAPNDEVRKTLMPIANKYRIQEILDACQEYFEETGRRLTFEYSLVGGVNDSAEDARELAEIFGPGEVERIYLNFSDPWPKDRHARRRLTSPPFMAVYDQILQKDGRVEFKTDNQDLFSYSLEAIPEAGWRIIEYTRDLHHSEMAEGNVMTEYEAKFSAQGKPICKLVAVR